MPSEAAMINNAAGCNQLRSRGSECGRSHPQVVNGLARLLRQNVERSNDQRFGTRCPGFHQDTRTAYVAGMGQGPGSAGPQISWMLAGISCAEVRSQPKMHGCEAAQPRSKSFSGHFARTFAATCIECLVTVRKCCACNRCP